MSDQDKNEVKKDEVAVFKNEIEIEAINAVRKINEEIYEQTEEEDGFCPIEGLVFKTNGFGLVIKFFGDQIWNDEDSERKYDEEKDEDEPMEGFLRREVMRIVNEVGKIKL